MKIADCKAAQSLISINRLRRPGTFMEILEFLDLLGFAMGVLIVIVLVVGAFEIVTRRKRQE